MAARTRSSARPRYTSIRQLPDDCLYQIFQRLGNSDDRDSFGLTCHQWLRVQNSSRRVLQLEWSSNYLSLDYLIEHHYEIDESQLSRLLLRFNRLESLSLAGCTRLRDPALAMLIHHGSNLRTLTLECCPSFTDLGFSFIASGCPLLTKINLHGCKITDVGLENLSKSCTGLTHLNLSQCQRISDDGIRSLFVNCLGIASLDVSSCRGVKGRGFGGCCTVSLSYLRAQGCSFDEEGMRAVFSGGGLQHLNLSNLPRDNMGHWGFASVEPRLLAMLRVVDFSNCVPIEDGAVARIAESCPLLREWNLRMCCGVTVVGWRSIGANCVGLEVLCTDLCEGFDDAGLAAVRDGCPRLRKLFLRECPKVKMSAVRSFLGSRPGVEIIGKEGGSVAIRPFELEVCRW